MDFYHFYESSVDIHPLIETNKEGSVVQVDQ